MAYLLALVSALAFAYAGRVALSMVAERRAAKDRIARAVRLGYAKATDWRGKPEDNPCISPSWDDEALSQKLAFYGFTSNPLTKDEMKNLRLAGFDIESAYGVASDVAAGFSLADAIAAAARP